MAKSKLAKYKKRRKTKKKNPETSEAVELATNIGAGFAGYAATRLISRMAYVQALKKYPKASKHIHVAATAVGAAGVYFGSKHWDKVDEYHEAAALGAGVAILQTAMQTYLPQIGWVVADVSPEQYSKKAKSVAPRATKADLESMLPPPNEGDESNPTAQQDLGNFGTFDLDAILAEDSSLEAVEIGQMPPVDDGSGDDGEIQDYEDPIMGMPDDLDDDIMSGWDGVLTCATWQPAVRAAPLALMGGSAPPLGKLKHQCPQLASYSWQSQALLGFGCFERKTSVGATKGNRLCS